MLTARYLLYMVLCGSIVFSAATSAAEQFVRLVPDISPGYVPAETELEGGIWMSVTNSERDIRTSPNRIKDDEINNYVKKVICELGPAFCNDIRVYIMRMPYFNASMYPNGMMVVWSGLLLRIRNEAQLAAVLGHEMGHYLKKHSLKRFNDVKMKANLSMVLSLGVSAVGYATGSAAIYEAHDIGQIMLMASIYAYSRDSEAEADKYGIQLVYDADYDPREVSTIWSNMQTEMEAADKKGMWQIPFFTTHPSPKTREKDLQSHAEALMLDDTTGNEAYTDRYYDLIRPHLSLLLSDELNLNQYGRTEFLLNDLLNECAQRESCQDAGIYHFYKGEIYRTRNKEGDLSIAMEQYHLSTQFASAPPESYRAIGLIELKNKNLDIAKGYLREYLQRSTAPNDLEMIEYYLNMEN